MGAKTLALTKSSWYKTEDVMAVSSIRSAQSLGDQVDTVVTVESWTALCYLLHLASTFEDGCGEAIGIILECNKARTDAQERNLRLWRVHSGNFIQSLHLKFGLVVVADVGVDDSARVGRVVKLLSQENCLKTLIRRQFMMHPRPLPTYH